MGEEQQEPKVVLNVDQERAVMLVRGGRNIFLTGPAGTGKSLTLAKIISDAEMEGRTVYVTGTTGVAASLLGGVAKSVRTFHAWASIGLGKYTPSAHAKFILRNETIRSRIVETDILIVDEISMLDPAFLAKVNDVVQIVRTKHPSTRHLAHRPFGGIQVVFTGDFGQLPPVQKDRKEPFFLFQDSLWTKLIDECVVLTKVYRQSDVAFVDILMRIRNNTITDDDVRLIKSTENNKLGDGYIKPTVLYCRNCDVDRMNLEELGKLEGKAFYFLAKDEFRDEQAKKDFGDNLHLHGKLPLKVGAQVMLLVNDSPTTGLVNGSRGVVTLIKLKDSETPDDIVTVRFLNGIERTYTRHKKECQDEHGALVASRTQFPFRLAWAITIHKSQGMTIDYLDIDLRGAFEVSQVYVAISRGVGLDKIRVRNFQREYIKTSPAVLEFHQNIKNEYSKKRKREV